jgi:hypothetical protein
MDRGKENGNGEKNLIFGLEGAGIGLDDGTEVKLESGKRFFENQADVHWLTTKEAANFLRISSKSLLNLTSSGRVRSYGN